VRKLGEGGGEVSSLEKMMAGGTEDGGKKFQLLRETAAPPKPLPVMSEADTPQIPQSTEAELIAVRREKMAKLRELGIDPFGGRYAVTTTPAALFADFSEGLQVKVAGRITALRDMGKSCFFSLSDVHGSIQGWVSTKNLGETEVAAWKCLDRGDWIGIEGETFLTKTGEPTVKLANFTVLSKSLRPMPDKWHGVADREIKYRKRHLDLMGNADSAALFVKRSLMLAEIRRFLQDRGFLEVETPMLHDIAGGAAARPFETHHNALGMPLTLRIAPELFLKRLLVGGFTKIFELNRSFRNEGISRRHNPEFTMLEAYWAFSDFEEMADLVEELTCHLAEKFCGGLEIEHKNDDGEVTRVINLARPWKRESYHTLIAQAAGADFFEITAEQRRGRCEMLGVQLSAGMADHEVIQQVFEKLVEEKTFDPCFVTRVSSELVPLAKITPGGKTVEVYELIINGQEISPGYSELNDPDVQRQRLEAQSGEETQKVDYDFIETLEHGMPPAGGIGIGLDRLCMMLTGAPTIRDVVLFPLLKRKD
jgi:lysyl-tRNA synthetase, class II